MANANGWGDGSVNNNIGWGKGADNTIGWGAIHADSYAGATDIVGTPDFDPDAQAFITAASITDPTQQAAINTLVVDLKGYSIWTKINALYPFVGGTASTHKFNLKDPRDLDAAFRLVFSGGWTHSSTGALPNGTNGYADTKFTPSSNQILDSNGLGCYITQNSSLSGDPVIMGTFSSNQSSLLQVTSTSLNCRLNGGNSLTTIIGGAGSFDIQKTASITTKQYKNAVLLKTFNSGGSLPSFNIFLGTMSVNNTTPYATGYVNSQFRFVYLSDGLSDTEISNLRTAVQALQTTLSRNI